MADELELGTIGSPEATLEIDDAENEFVVRDSNDNIVARRDESAGRWVLAGGVETPELNGGVTGNQNLTNIAGENLSIASGNLDAEGVTTAVIDDTDSPFTTSDEDVIYANTANGAVTVTLASADATNGNEIEVVNIDGSNAVTVNTEGTETIDPNAGSSKTISNAGWSVEFTADGSNWDSSLAAEYESVSLGETTIGGGKTINQVEFGEATISGAAAAADATWDTDSNTTTTVTFDTAFSTEPQVVIGSRDPGQIGFQILVDDVTTTDFRLVLRNYSTNDLSGNSYSVEWIAVN